jgi:hypothetical protein
MATIEAVTFCFKLPESSFRQISPYILSTYPQQAT